MFADSLNLESLKGFINESFSSCSSVKIAQMHMDVSPCVANYVIMPSFQEDLRSLAPPTPIPWGTCFNAVFLYTDICVKAAH